MTRVEDSQAFMAGLMSDPRTAASVFARETRATRRALTAPDIYDLVLEDSRAIVRFIRNHYGSEVLAAIRNRSERFVVTQAHVDAYVDMLVRGFVMNEYGALTAATRSAGIGHLLHADHIIEGRIHRILRDGTAGFTARSSDYAHLSSIDRLALERHLGSEFTDDRIIDALAILVPVNELVAVRLARLMPDSLARHGSSGLSSALPWNYFHLGLGSKTSRMANLIPWRLEGNFTYRQLFDATRWVVCYELGAPGARRFQLRLQDDFMHSVRVGLETSDETVDMVRTSLFGRSSRASIDEIEAGVRRHLSLRTLTIEDFQSPNFPKFSPIFQINDFTEATVESIREIYEP